MSTPGNSRWAFGPFRLDGSQHLLFRDGQLVPLSPKAVEVLLVLIERHGQLIEKEELMKAVWPDSFVEEANLAVHISQLRKTLVDESGSHYIETIPRRGYRFIGEVIDLTAHEAMVASRLDERTEQDQREVPEPATPSVAEAGVPKRPRHGLAGQALWLVGGAGLLAFFVFLGVKHFRQKAQASTASATTVANVATPMPLVEKDSVVLADIANDTGEPIFDTTLRQGMAIELEQSPFLHLVPDTSLQDSLRDMGKPAGTALTPEVSLEICQRTGGKAVLEGWIARLGTEYTLGVRAINCRTGDHIADLQSNAASKEQVLKALGDATRQLRAKLGESLSMLQQFDTPIEEATTPSLEALQAYSIGRATMVQKGEDASSVPYFERAIRIDPDFAMAYAALGNAYSNLDEPGLASSNITRAYALREHVSQRERFYIESHYYQFVTGDLDKAGNAYEHWAETYPDDLAPRTNLAVIYSNLGKFQQSLEKAREALSIAPGDTQNYANLMNAYISLDQPKEAEAVAEQAFERKLDAPYLRLNLYELSFLKSDEAGMEKQITWSRGEPAVEDTFLDHEASTAADSGQVAKAREFADRAAAAAIRAGEKETAAEYELNAALWEALFGNRPQATQRSERAVGLSGDRDTQYGAAITFALAGETGRAKAIAKALGSRFPEDTFVQYLYLPAIRGAVCLSERGNTDASHELAAATQYELGVAGGLLPVYIRGLFYLQSGDGKRAASEFQKILDHPGVVLNSPIGSLALLQQGRAYVLAGDKAKALSAYHGFLSKWQNADPDTPVLIETKAEIQKLH